jgi:hypothetical protein
MRVGSPLAEDLLGQAMKRRWRLQRLKHRLTVEKSTRD